MECSHCKSTNITTNIKVTGGGGIHKPGLMYKEKKVWVKTEPLVADLCNDCGTIRFYIKNKDKEWIDADNKLY
jgi:uncharacterized OB-fold protein